MKNCGNIFYGYANWIEEYIPDPVVSVDTAASSAKQLTMIEELKKGLGVILMTARKKVLWTIH